MTVRVTNPKATKPINIFGIFDKLSEGQLRAGETTVGDIEDTARGLIACNASSADW